MGRQRPFSAAVVAADVAEAAIAALDERGNQRGLSAPELAQLAAFEAVRREAERSTPASWSVFMHDREASTAPFREALHRCAETTAASIPLVALLGMRSSVPGDWQRLPLSLDAVLWLGVTRFAEGLSEICASGLSTARRQEQLAAMRDLQGALGKVLRLSLQPAPPERDVSRAIGRADKVFTKVALAIGDDLPAIRTEAAALRARR